MPPTSFMDASFNGRTAVLQTADHGFDSLSVYQSADEANLVEAPP